MDLRSIQAGDGGALAAAARGALCVPAAGWALAQWLKPIGFRTLRRTRHLPVPVISVGNLTAGGTGKTPFVAWLCERLLASGRSPGVLARGYGPVVVPSREGGPLNDEGAVLRELEPAVPQVQQADRVAGGARLLEAHPGTDVVVLDDGFQHWRIARDLDIVLIDATCPFGYGHYLPRGLLREKPRALARAGAVVITRADRVPSAEVARIESEIHRHTAAPVSRAITRPRATLEGRCVFAACGIGNPRAFVATLEKAGATVVGQRFFDDHQAFVEPGTLDEVRGAARSAGAEAVAITRKDAVKIGRVPEDVVVLDIDLEIVAGEAALLAAIDRALR